MSPDPLFVPATETGILRLFQVDISPDALHDLKAPKRDMPPTAAAIADMVGLDWIDEGHAEVFDVSDLEGLGLANYLVQGAGVPAQVIDAKRAELDAIEGVVLILYSRAFEGEELRLLPQRNLSLIAYLAEERDPITFEPIPSKAATAPTGLVPPRPTPQAAVLKAILWLPLVVLLIGLLVWWLLL